MFSLGRRTHCALPGEKIKNLGGRTEGPRPLLTVPAVEKKICRTSTGSVTVTAVPSSSSSSFRLMNKQLVRISHSTTATVARRRCCPIHQNPFCVVVGRRLQAGERKRRKNISSTVQSIPAGRRERTGVTEEGHFSVMLASPPKRKKKR